MKKLTLLLVGYIHNLIASEHDISKINEQNYFALLNKDQVKNFSKLVVWVV